MTWRAQRGREAVLGAEPARWRPRGVSKSNAAKTAIPLAAPLIQPGAVTLTQAQQTLDAAMAPLFAGAVGTIPNAVSNAASTILSAIQAVGPTLPQDQVVRAIGMAQDLASFQFTSADDTAFVLGTLAMLYNAYQGLLYAIGAPLPPGMPFNEARAIDSFLQISDQGGCALLTKTPIPTAALQDAMVMSGSLPSGYTYGTYDLLTATALQSLLGGLRTVPTPCTASSAPAAAIVPGPIAPLPPLPPPSSTPATAPAAATTQPITTAQTSTSTTPWLIGGAVVAGAGVLWLLLHKHPRERERRRRAR